MKQGSSQSDEKANGKTAFVGKTVLVGLLAAKLAACTPEVTVNNIPFDAPGSATDTCTLVTDCKAVSAYLREPGNTAGADYTKVGNAYIVLEGTFERADGIKVAAVRLELCDKSAKWDIPVGESVVLSTGDGSFKVTINAIDSDAAGLRVKVTVAPVCPDTTDGGTDSP